MSMKQLMLKVVLISGWSTHLRSSFFPLRIHIIYLSFHNMHLLIILAIPPSPSHIENHPKHFFCHRASATAKATVAAFAASEGHAHPRFSSKLFINQFLFDLLTRVVELPKTEEGLGFNVMGGKEQNSPIYISRIIPGSQPQKLSLVVRIMM